MILSNEMGNKQMNLDKYAKNHLSAQAIHFTVSSILCGITHDRLLWLLCAVDDGMH